MLFQNKYRIETARFQNWDYSFPGYYFVTICTRDRLCLFGEIVGSEMQMNANGKIVFNEWEKSFELRPVLKQDDFVIMPNHFHAIVQILDLGGSNGNNGNGVGNCRDVARNVSTGQDVAHYVSTPENTETHFTSSFRSTISPKSNSLSTVIRSFKSAVTNQMHNDGFKGNVWQSRFYDHVIRKDRELFAIRQYIKLNPSNWESDKDIVETLEQKQGKQPWFVYMP